MPEMTNLVRTYLAVSLALMLALTGQSLAVARGTTGPADQIALCTGTGPVMVYVDENGTPTGPPVLCPDFALNLLAAVALPDFTTLPDTAKPSVLAIHATMVRDVRSRHRAMARAPPRPV